MMNTDSPAANAKLIGGRLCLDFANSVGGRILSRIGERARKVDYLIRGDKLENYSDLLVWSRHSELLTDKEARQLQRLAESNAGEAKQIYRRAIALREAIFRIFTSIIEAGKLDAGDIAVLNKELAVAKKHEQLIHKADGFAWGWDEHGETLGCLLWPVAKSAAEVLTSEDVSRVRQCGGANCGWIFLDTSRNRRRQWCDMKDCGNLAKVRRFRQRRQESQ